jgi:hypothetical protein
MRYIEDLVEQFALGHVHVSTFDERISQSLGNQCFNGKAFTHKQADIALRLVKKYRNQFIKLGINNIEELLDNPPYKFALRTIDNVKSVTIDQTNKKFILRFPFNQDLVTILRNLNQKEKLTKAEWDPNNKYWTLDLNEVSLSFLIDNFSKDFEFDEQILEHIEKYSQITNNFEEYVPTLIKQNNIYQFKNIKCNFQSDNLLTALVESAKLGVHVYDDTVANELAEYVKEDPLAKIYEHSYNQKFFIDKSKYARQEVITLVKNMNVNTAIFVDETINANEISKWISDLTNVGISLDDIGVFFRRKNDKDGIEFNAVIKQLRLNKEANSSPKWVFLSNKYPKSLLKNNHKIDICFFVNRYITSHYSITNTSKNSVFTLQYNEHKTSEADIVNL